MNSVVMQMRSSEQFQTSLFFFHKKILDAQKAQKAQKAHKKQKIGAGLYQFLNMKMKENILGQTLFQIWNLQI